MPGSVLEQSVNVSRNFGAGWSASNHSDPDILFRYELQEPVSSLEESCNGLDREHVRGEFVQKRVGHAAAGIEGNQIIAQALPGLQEERPAGRIDPEDRIRDKGPAVVFNGLPGLEPDHFGGCRDRPAVPVPCRNTNASPRGR